MGIVIKNLTISMVCQCWKQQEVARRHHSGGQANPNMERRQSRPHRPGQRLGFCTAARLGSKKLPLHGFLIQEHKIQPQTQPRVCVTRSKAHRYPIDDSVNLKIPTEPLTELRSAEGLSIRRTSTDESFGSTGVQTMRMSTQTVK